MKNDLSIRCRFCPVETTARDKFDLRDRYARHLRNCGAMARACVERGIPKTLALADTLKRSGLTAADLAEDLHIKGKIEETLTAASAAPDPLPEWTEKLLQKNPMLEAAS